MAEPELRQISRALPTRPPPPGVRRVAEAIEERLDQIVDMTLTDVLAEVPVYHRRGSGVADDTRRAASYVYASFIESLHTGREPNEAVARSLANVGADRAVQGIPLGDLLQAFRISARSLAAGVQDVISEKDLDRDAALWVMEAIVSWIDVVSNLAAHDYSRAQARLLHEDEERRQAFLLDVLYGAISGEQALSRAKEVAWDPATDYWLAVVGRAGAMPPQEAANGIAAAVPVSSVTNVQGNLVVLAPVTSAGDADRIESAVLGAADEHGLHVGMTVPRAGVAGVRRSYLEAAESLAIALAADEAAVRYGDAVLDRILRSDPALLAELVERSIAPLVAYDRSRNTDLVLTLESYFANNESPTRTAAALHTHPQTIRYRLGRVNAITGLPLDDVDGRLQLMLGLRARRLLPRADDASVHHI